MEAWLREGGWGWGMGLVTEVGDVHGWSKKVSMSGQEDRTGSAAGKGTPGHDDLYGAQRD